MYYSKINKDMEEISIKCYKDHRIAMISSLLVFKNHKIILDDYECVNKTYPTF